MSQSRAMGGRWGRKGRERKDSFPGGTGEGSEFQAAEAGRCRHAGKAACLSVVADALGCGSK